MWYPNLVKDHTEIFLNLKCNLDFATDTEMRDMMKRHYYFESLTYPDVDAEALALQIRADEISDYYNQLYKIQLETAKFNPLENYDLREEASTKSETNSTSKANSESTMSEFPMDTNTKKPVNNTVSGSNGSGNVNGNATLNSHKHGNIGVQTLGDIEESTEEMYKRVYQLKLRYIQEFTRYFMVEI